MANDYFQFQQFKVKQDRCAMKVGTDGTLLGAWSIGGLRVLDIGTGTGLVALMMAQRFKNARVVGVDIDMEAVEQACENVLQSPFKDRIEIVACDIKEFRCSEKFDAIVCNPPYFENSKVCQDSHRTTARHAFALSYGNLMTSAKRLLDDNGELSVVIPFDCKVRLEAEASSAGFFKVRECAVRTTPHKQPRRYLLAFRNHSSVLESTEAVIETSPGVRSEWYNVLTKDFYL